MPHAVKCAAAAFCGGKIFLFGGFTDSYKILSQLQIFDIMTSHWSFMTSSMIDYTCAKAACINSKIYLLGGSSKKMKVYDVISGVISNAPSMTQKRDNCGVSVLGKNLFVTGGVNDSTSLDSVECFYPSKGVWETIAVLPEKIYRHSSVATRIPIYRKEALKKKNLQSFERKNTFV